MSALALDLNSRQIQLLAIDALLEHARAGGSNADATCKVLQRVVEMGLQMEADPAHVRVEDLNEARASLLCLNG